MNRPKLSDRRPNAMKNTESDNGGSLLTEPTPQEKEDERETEIVIAPWPTKGVKGDDGMLPPHKHIAYYYEYPEEGCVPLGSPKAELCGVAAKTKGGK